MKSKEWDGSGMPPVGTVCEYHRTDGNEWRKCEIVAHYHGSAVAVDVLGQSVYLIADMFRPIKTPEQIAAEERLHAIGEMIKLVKIHHTYKDVMSVLYDAGYRKTEVKK